jgi:hypothetical protein
LGPDQVFIFAGFLNIDFEIQKLDFVVHDSFLQA